MVNEIVNNIIGCCIREAKGMEICGFILIDSAGNPDFYLLNNLSKEPHCFVVGRPEFLRLERYAQRRGLRIAAFVHSHASGLELSGSDIQGLCNGQIPWIVVALTPSG